MPNSGRRNSSKDFLGKLAKAADQERNTETICQRLGLNFRRQMEGPEKNRAEGDLVNRDTKQTLELQFAESGHQNYSWDETKFTKYRGLDYDKAYAFLGCSRGFTIAPAKGLHEALTKAEITTSEALIQRLRSGVYWDFLRVIKPNLDEYFLINPAALIDRMPCIYGKTEEEALQNFADSLKLRS
ncbi:MAG: hypothetical protein ACYDHY_07865 [Acidiferrobacterales bacterium]